MPTASRPPRLRLLLRRPGMLLWCAFLGLIPFYVVKSGLPQPQNGLILLILPLAYTGWKGRFTPTVRRPVQMLTRFVVWITLIDLFWALVLWDTSKNALLFPVYYVYNLTVFAALLILYQRYGDAFLRLTVYVLYGAVIFQVVASLVRAGGGIRQSLFFQNPNELGYYALLSASVFALTRRRLGLSQRMSMIGLLLSSYLALISASRSALAGIGLLYIVLFFSNPRIIIIAGLVAGFLTLTGAAESTIETVQMRVTEDRFAELTFFQERGYDRIWNNLEYVPLGAGEGHTYRWKETTALGTAEIHSAAGTMLFCYGVVGTALFIIFIAAVMRGTGLRTALILVPAMTYSIAHQGLRFTSFWILLALFVALKDSALRTRALSVPKILPTPVPSPA